MKHALTSAGLLALGAVSLYALDPEMSRQQTGRPFTIAATVRGFYDDNVTTAPDKIVFRAPLDPTDPNSPVVTTGVIHPRDESFGFQVSPSIHLNLPMEQTFISLGYIYSLTWYESRDPNDIDQSHEFSGKLRHSFSPRYQVGVDERFVITSEPTVAERFGIITAPTRTRTQSDVWHNYGAIEANIGLTRLVSLSLGYVNNWYDYEAEGPGSRSALLDRIEHMIRADARYQFNPKLIGVVGYTFGFNSFTGDDVISPATAEVTVENPDDPTGPPIVLRRARRAVFSEERDSRSHYGYVGVDYDVTAKLQATIRVGAQFTEYPDLEESSANPYADVSLRYRILRGTSLEGGIRHARNATDVSAVDERGRPTLDAETTAVYAQLEHQIIPNLVGSVMAQYQHSTFNDGVNDGSTEDLWLMGLNLNYSFNRHLSAEVGYSYDILDSHLKQGDRGYDRNRVYIGLTARY
jgi:hypothetical protein